MMTGNGRGLRLVGNIIIYVLMTILLIVTIFPVLYSLSSSLKSTQDILAGSGFFPKKLHLENYVEAWNKSNFKSYFWNSLYMTFLL